MSRTSSPCQSTTINLPDADATARLAASLRHVLGSGDVVLLSGPIGAGKSHFARSLIAALLADAGQVEDIPSPTFTLVQTYQAGALEIWHSDLYRLVSLDEVAELGLFDAFETALSLVEWPELLGESIPAQAIRIDLAPGGTEDGRILTLTARQREWDRLHDVLLTFSEAQAMHDRARTVAMFLGHAGWGGANRTTLAGDASARRYDRLTQPDGSSAVLMDAPPASGEDIRPFTAMARWLTEQGFSAPLILADDAEDGLALLEDLGDNLYARVCAREPECEAALYEAAVDLLADLQRLDPPQWIAPYCGDTYEREAALLTDWYLPGATGKRVAKDLDHDYRALVRAACLDLPLARPVFVLRDYHAENLLWLPERMRHRRVGLLDFQDALAGHPVYDLVSLIEDARRDTSATLRRDMADRFAAATGTARDEVDLAVATLGAQRNLKIVGIFARLWLRDGKPAYLAMIPRVWAHLVRDLEHPALAALARLVNDHVPAPTADILARLRGART